MSFFRRRPSLPVLGESLPTSSSDNIAGKRKSAAKPTTPNPAPGSVPLGASASTPIPVDSPLVSSPPIARRRPSADASSTARLAT